MTDPNMILESIRELQGKMGIGFVLILIAIGACAIIIVWGQRNDRP